MSQHQRHQAVGYRRATTAYVIFESGTGHGLLLTSGCDRSGITVWHMAIHAPPPPYSPSVENISPRKHNHVCETRSSAGKPDPFL